MRLFLYLISIIYNIITTLRNILFDYHILKSKKHKIPVICIGNLSLGGSGKTPQTNYIAKLLSKDYNIAILSRGYGRNSSGFHYVELDSSPEFVGDEPAVKKITKDYPDTNVILLDDAFQHRWINPGLNILITTFKKPYTKDYLIPLGRLREHKKGADRSNSSYYYSVTDYETTGQIVINENVYEITGNSWYDHEWSSGVLPQNVIGWDWFSITFRDSSQLMIYQLKRFVLSIR